jgi:hypothetical protein
MRLTSDAGGGDRLSGSAAAAVCSTGGSGSSNAHVHRRDVDWSCSSFTHRDRVLCQQLPRRRRCWCRPLDSGSSIRGPIPEQIHWPLRDVLIDRIHAPVATAADVDVHWASGVQATEAGCSS